jgi:hypothetical protein
MVQDWIEEQLRRSAHLPRRCGYAFPVVAQNRGGCPIDGCVLVATCVSPGPQAVDSALAREVLREPLELLGHLEKRARARGHELRVLPGPSLQAEFKVTGDSCGLALAIADQAAENDLIPSGLVALSGEIKWKPGAPEVAPIGEAQLKLLVLEQELPGCHFFCCTESDLPTSARVTVHALAAGTSVEAVFEQVREVERQLAACQRDRRGFGVTADEACRPPTHPSLADALALPVRNEPHPERSFQVRLKLDIDFDPSHLTALIRPGGGWRLAERKDYYSWFAKMNLEAMHAWARDLLLWHDDGKGERPAVLLMDLSRLPEACVLNPPSGTALRLSQIDVVAYGSSSDGGRARAAMGLVFEGGACSLGEALSFVSSRANLLKFRVALRGGAEVSVKDLAWRIEHSLREGTRPQPDVSPGAPAPGRGSVQLWQIVHVTQSVWPAAPTATQADLLALAWRLVATVSKPKPGYPKGLEILHDLDSSLAQRTKYGLHDNGGSFLVGATDEKFNEENKPRVVMETHYLHFLLASRHALVGREPLPATALQLMSSVELHRLYYRHCEEWFSRTNRPAH